MAYAPCSRCGRRFVGKSTYVYAATLSPSGDRREKARLCPACGQDTLTRAQSRFQDAHTSLWPGPEDDETCPGCELTLEGETQPVFITLYPVNSERLDWYARAHPHCAERLLPGLTSSQ